ncbi:unnamed protein product [Trichobilharzia szidati]|nr:unnamed protein product [Trichobilharzia szidati]
MEYKRLSVLIFVMLAVYSYGVSDVQAKKKCGKRCAKPQKDNEDWESSCYTNVIDASLKRFLSDYKDDEIKKEMERLLAIADANKPVEKEETDEPGWETETESEREIIVGTVKRGEKIQRGGPNERVILREKKPFSKDKAKKKGGKRCAKPQKDNEDWESSCYTNVIDASLKRFLSDYKDDEIKKEMERLLAIADANKPVEKEETDEPGWETETESEREIIVGTVKRGEKIQRGGPNERVILKEKKPFSKDKGQSDWEITDEDEREVFVRGH